MGRIYPDIPDTSDTPTPLNGCGASQEPSTDHRTLIITHGRRRLTTTEECTAMTIRLGLGLPQNRQYDLGTDVPHAARAAERIGYDSVWVYERAQSSGSSTGAIAS
jgi:hypothetical protein